MSFVEIGDEHIFKLKIQKGTWSYLLSRWPWIALFFLPDDINLDLRVFLHSRDEVWFVYNLFHVIVRLFISLIMMQEYQNLFAYDLVYQYNLSHTVSCIFYLEVFQFFFSSQCEKVYEPHVHWHQGIFIFQSAYIFLIYNITWWILIVFFITTIIQLGSNTISVIMIAKIVLQQLWHY